MRVGIAILFGVAQWLRKTISPSENEKTDYRLTFFLSWCIILDKKRVTAFGRAVSPEGLDRQTLVWRS